MIYTFREKVDFKVTGKKEEYGQVNIPEGASGALGRSKLRLAFMVITQLVPISVRLWNFSLMLVSKNLT